jgi:isopropylmalate/homocitrate/citramalate synthase
MVMEYAELRGTTDGMDTTVITELAEYYEKEIGYEIPPMTPFVGRDFNVTRAGIHADGLLKDEEIYNIFNTEKILNRPAAVSISNVSGHAAIAFWINRRFRLEGSDQVDKKAPFIAKMKEWIDAQYAADRQTIISDEEMLALVTEYAPFLFDIEKQRAAK